VYATTLKNLIEELQKLPGIGPKSAQRLAFYFLATSKKSVEDIVASIMEAKDKITYCSVCFNVTDVNPCNKCTDATRQDDSICVVAETKDLAAIERSGAFRGKYHVLGGLLSPLDGIEPETLRINELVTRLSKNNVKEVVLAISPTTEGEATIIYLTRLLKPLGLNMTRIAYGLPMGADMDYADPVTLFKSFEGRRIVSHD